MGLESPLNQDNIKPTSNARRGYALGAKVFNHGAIQDKGPALTHRHGVLLHRIKQGFGYGKGYLDFPPGPNAGELRGGVLVRARIGGAAKE